MDFWRNEWNAVADMSEVTGIITKGYKETTQPVWGGCIYNLKGVLLGCDESYEDTVFLYRTMDDIFLTKEQTMFFIRLGEKLQMLCNLTNKIGLSNEELNLRAVLSMLKQAEAGQTNPPLDYNSWNHGYTFTEDSYRDNPQAYASHPGENPNTGSSAAGAYQFLYRFYKMHDFSPQSQDHAAVNLMPSAGYKAAIEGNIISFIQYNKSRWTSLKYWMSEDLYEVFYQCRAKELTGNSLLAVPVGFLKR